MFTDHCNDGDSFQIASKARLAMSDKMSTEQFCLRWNDFHSNITSAFSDIRDDDEFLDVTLVSFSNILLILIDRIRGVLALFTFTIPPHLDFSSSALLH